MPSQGKKNPLNANFEKNEFQELWSRINRKAIYAVDFETNEFIGKVRHRPEQPDEDGGFWLRAFSARSSEKPDQSIGQSFSQAGSGPKVAARKSTKARTLGERLRRSG